MIKKISFKNKRGLTLCGFVHIPKQYDTAVIFCHGFPSTSRGHMATKIGRDLGPRYLTLRFDFSHTPVSGGKFEDKLMSREVEDIRSAIDFLSHTYKFKKLVLIGHSTGAIDASLYAHCDRRIDKVILTGAVHDLANAARYDFTDYQMYEFWKKGHIVYRRPKHWVNGERLNKKFYDEFFKLDIPRAIKKYHKPLLIIHGEQDVIPWDMEAYALYTLANRPKRFILIKGADHSFSAPYHWKSVVRHMVSFIG
ncbi:MAG TPA: alpha/beta fold hydrolase [Candidatus Paceibacterota bacterium]